IRSFHLHRRGTAMMEFGSEEELDLVLALREADPLRAESKAADRVRIHQPPHEVPDCVRVDRFIHIRRSVPMKNKKKPARPRRTLHKGMGVTELVYRTGVMDGRFWAGQFATREEMARVAKAAGRNPERLFKTRLRSGHIATDLYQLILGERGTPAEVEAFWNHGLDEPDGLTVV